MLVDRDGTCVSNSEFHVFVFLSSNLIAIFEAYLLFEQNTMPGWDPLSMWNPVPASADPDCKLNPMYQERGMGYGASYGGAY
jgi:hypothetical protein